MHGVITSIHGAITSINSRITSINGTITSKNSSNSSLNGSLRPAARGPAEHLHRRGEGRGAVRYVDNGRRTPRAHGAQLGVARYARSQYWRWRRKRVGAVIGADVGAIVVCFSRS
eukprot:184764-Rhodomonas_salina.3